MRERVGTPVLVPGVRDIERRNSAAFGGGAVIGALGGLIGLGGAEFRLPLLIGAFRFAALQAVILNKAMSLVVVASALPFRAATVPFAVVAAHWPIIVNLLAGSLLGAWFGAGWATRLASQTLYRIIAVLLLGIALVLVLGHDTAPASGAMLAGAVQMIAGVAAGFVIGIVAALLGVAGGELLIPTLVLLFGVDIKLAGSLSLAVSLPTMLVGFARYSRDRSFVVLGENRRFVLIMAAGSICGSFIGGRLLGLVPSAVLLPLLAAILILSAVKVWRHHGRPARGTRKMVADIDVIPGSPSWLRLARLAKLLSSATLVWLSIEGAIGVVAGVLAGHRADRVGVGAP